MSEILREPRTKADLLGQMRAERLKLDAAFARVPDHRMTLPGPMGIWSAKDMLAHLMCYEAWITAQVNPARRADLPAFDLVDYMDDTEERNQLYYRLYKDMPLADVREEARQVFDTLLAEVEAANEDALNSPMAFDAANNLNPATWDTPLSALWPLWPLWKWVSYESCEHYWDHIPDLEAWASQK